MASNSKWLVFDTFFLICAHKEFSAGWSPLLLASLRLLHAHVLRIGQSLSSLCKRLTFSGVTAVTSPIMSHDSSSQSPEAPRSKSGKHDTSSSDANIRNFAPVARIMKTALPENAKIAKEAKECMQECVSEFISFITSEGTTLHCP
jgi:hypothetical protein